MKFKCLVFNNNKITKLTKKQKSMAHSQEKYTHHRYCPRERQEGRLTRQRLLNNSLNDGQKTKDRYGESKKNNV